ncbi:MAG: hypothetical protein H7240_02800 [Glaciimonas sp.]|nr:hypothetical protein [Glaciimonas sp.]
MAQAVLTDLLLTGAVSAIFAQKMQPVTKGVTENGQHQPKDSTSVMQKRLAELKQKLNLKPSQQLAWEIFSNGLTVQIATFS